MPYVIDGVVLITAILITLGGVRKGIIKAAAEFIGAILSAVFASLLGGVIAQWVYNTFFREGFYSRILEVTKGNSSQEAVTSLFDSLPDFIVRLLSEGGITEASVTHSVGSVSVDVAGAITAALSPVFISIIRIFAVIILFIVFMLVVRGLATLLNGIRHIPIISQLNGLLGGVFGFLFALLILWLILALISFLLPVMDDSIRKSVESALNDSVLTRIILAINPLGWIFN